MKRNIIRLFQGDNILEIKYIKTINFVITFVLLK